MQELPAGTITLLFSDIEGSTALLLRLGDRYAEVLSDQRVLLRAAFERAGGHELGTEGDSFFVVFSRAIDALNAVVDAQRALATHPWPEGAAVRVRMGLHTGEPARQADGYVGLDVHRAARIAASAHGGQVVLSSSTREVVGAELAGVVDFRDLGWHRLKDLPQSERIFQLLAPGLDVDFPPLKSLGARSNLPMPPTPLVGRRRELDALPGMLREPASRLVTLTGVGGTGKTRLALAVASALDHDFPDGVFFVSLAAVTDLGVAWTVIADALDVAADGPTAGAVAEHLAGRSALIVFDNVEQFPAAGEMVAHLRAAAPEVAILVTSRRPLHVRGEHEYPLPPLPVPPAEVASVAEVSSSEATALFVQRASMVRPGFGLTDENAVDVAEICRRLDGLPLAIELAASRSKLLSPCALLARFDDRLGFKTVDTDRPRRQQSLRDTIAWSHDLLAPEFQGPFRRAGVFVDGCSLEAFARVAHTGADPIDAEDAYDIVAELVDHSLVTIADGRDGEPRVGMLQTIRDFAREQLTRVGELDDASRGHAQHYLRVAQVANDEIRGPQQRVVLDRIEAEHGNLRAALAWSLAPDRSDADAVVGLQLCNALSWFWYTHGHAAEGRRWFERAIARAPAQSRAEAADALRGLAILLDQLGEENAAQGALERSLGLAPRSMTGTRSHER